MRLNFRLGAKATVYHDAVKHGHLGTISKITNHLLQYLVFNLTQELGDAAAVRIGGVGGLDVIRNQG